MHEGVTERRENPKTRLYGGLGYDLYTTLMEDDELVAQQVKNKQTNKQTRDTRDVDSISGSGRFLWRRI